LLPAAPCTGDPMWSPSSSPSSPSAPSYVSTSTSVPSFGKPTYTSDERPSDLLNRMSQVHERALSDLRTDGWYQKGDMWRRSGKNGGSFSAIFNFYEKEGLYIFTNFSSNSPHFGRRGYSDVQVICELEFGGNFLKCIAELAQQYLR
jgi:hypothetical protein